MKLHDFPDGKMLKVNRRNNPLHYRVYKKKRNNSLRAKIETSSNKVGLGLFVSESTCHL